MCKHLAAIVAAASVAFAAAPATATVTYYTNYAVYVAALGGTASVEDFNDTTLAPGLSFISSVGNIGGGKFKDRLVPGSQVTSFNFAGGTTNAFGGFFDLSPAGPGLGISFTVVPGQTLKTEVPNSYTGQFFGFISTTNFLSVVLSAGSQSGSAETYYLDNLTWGHGTPGAVPEPASWTMMLLGFGAMGGTLRARRKVAVSFG